MELRSVYIYVYSLLFFDEEVLYKCISPTDRTINVITTLSKSWSESYDNDGVPFTPQISRTEASSSNEI